MRTKTITFKTTLLIGLMALATSLFASTLSLDVAKDENFVGERPDGTLGIASSMAPAGTQELVDSINLKRQAKYKEISIRTGATLEQVKRLAGRKAILNTKPGNMIYSEGRWVKK